MLEKYHFELQFCAFLSIFNRYSTARRRRKTHMSARSFEPSAPDSVRRVGNLEPFQALFFEVRTSKEEIMQRREFISAAVGVAAAVASASQVFAQDYPDAGAIKKMPVGEGAAGAAKKGIEGEAGAAKKGVKGVIEKITEAIGGGEMEEMHPPKYKALEDASKCVVTGNDCLSIATACSR